MPIDKLIKFRRGLASEWTSTDPILNEGEIGVETDTIKAKYGDGTTAWTSLDYIVSWGVAGAGEANTASNLGGGDGLFVSKSGVDLRFKSLTEGTGIALTAGASEIAIAAAIVWGDITGTVSDQTDLQAELDAKIDIADGDSANMLVSDGSNFVSVPISGDATIAADGTMTVQAGSADSIILSAKVNEAAGITKGQVVYISGATGGFPQVSIADNTDFGKSDIMAVATESKTNGQTIVVTTTGMLENIDTSSFAEGSILYLGSAGALTDTHPSGIHAVQRIARTVKSNVSTGSILIELDQLTIINDHDGIMRFQIVNQNTGTSSSSAYTLVNDEAYRSSFSMVGSNYDVVAGIENSLVIYNEGYNKTVNAVDGNHGFEWWTDTTDSHDLSSTQKMTLSAGGALAVVGDITGNNLSGTNTGDQDLSGLQPLASVLTNTTASFTTAISNAIDANTTKATNATHTGDVTGSGALTIAAGAVDIAMLSATGTASSSTYLRGDNTWSAIAGGGDVSKVGTPVNNQLGVWTGDGTIEGDTGLAWDGSNLAIGGTVNLSGNAETAIFGDDTYTTKYVTIRDGAFYAARWGLQANTNISSSGTCVMASSKPIAFKSNTSTALDSLTVYDLLIDSSGNILVSGTVDGRDMATDGTKLDGIEASADVTDATNVISSIDGATITAVTVSAADKVLIQDASDSDNVKTVTAQSIADLAAGGTSAAIFYALGTGSANLGTTLANVPLATATFSDTGYTLATNQVTIGADLDGKRAIITWAVAGSGATNRVEIRSELQVGGVRVKGASNYTARNATQAQGGVTGSHMLTLSTGDVIRVQALRDGSTANLLADETHLSIQTID